MPRNAHHRLDHTGSDRHQSRAFHLARLLGAIRDSARLLDSMRHIGPRNYEIDSAVVLRARESVGAARVYLTAEEMPI